MVRLDLPEPVAVQELAPEPPWIPVLQAARVDPDIRRVLDLIRVCETVIRLAGLTGFNSMGSVRQDARAIVFETLAIRDHSDSYLEASVTSLERAQILDLLTRRVSGPVPLPYLTGEAFFCGLRFHVRPGVFIPRSALGPLLGELLAEVSWSSSPRALELGCGSGALAISIARAAPLATVDLTDIDPLAVAVALDNVSRHGLVQRCHVGLSDMYETVDASVRYDLVVANLPYVPAAMAARVRRELDAEPDSAIYRPGDGLDLVRRVLAGTADHLAEPGRLALEVGVANQAAVTEILGDRGHWWSLRGQPTGVVTVDREQLCAVGAQI